MACTMSKALSFTPSLKLSSTANKRCRRNVARACEPPTITNVKVEEPGSMADAGGAAAASVPPPKAKKDSFGDYFEFKSWGPEVINGRLAMWGFVTGAAAEMASGQSTFEQFTSGGGHFSFLLASALIIAASIMPRMQGENTSKPESKENGMWSASTELLNGRAAMVGFSVMMLQEAITGSPIF